jgi:hypothetical protein
VAEAVGETEVTGCTARDVGSCAVDKTAREPVGSGDGVICFDEALRRGR